MTKPGKILAVNDNDDDGDGIPDFADGFDWDGITSEDDRAAFDDPNTPEHEPEEQFVPVILVLPEGVNPSVAKVKLTYSASDPANLSRSGEGTAEDPYVYAPGAGALRLWTKDGSAARDKASLASGGDFVPNNVELSWSALPEGPTANTKRLWLEAITPSTDLGDQQITVALDPDGPGPGGYVESDAVRVTTPNWQVLQGDVDPATGRGDVGSASTVLHPLYGAAIPSNPVPHITVTSFDVGNVRNDGGDQLVADFRVVGAITFALADIAPEDGADLSTAVVRVGVNSYTIPLRRVDETPTLLRPYARSFEFAQILRGVPVVPGGNAVRVECIDEVLGNMGWAETTFAVAATNAPDEENPPAQPPTRDFFDTFLQSMKLRVDFADFTSLAEAAAAGPGAVRVDARNAPMDDPEPATSWAQLDLPPDEAPVIWAPDGTLLVLEDVSDLNLSSTELEHFTAYAIHPDKGIGLVLLHFEETAVDTNEFVSQYVEVSILLELIPDPGQPDTIQAGVRKTLWDSQGTWHTAVLTEDGPDSMRFTGSGLTIAIEALSGLGAAYRDLLTVTVTSTGQNINALKVGAKETTAQSQVFETSSEFKASASVWRNIWTEAWLGGPWSATPSGSWDYSSPGYYAPLVMELMAPAGLGPQLAVAFFDDADHPLMAIEGRQIAGSRGFPDVFAMVPQLLGGLQTALTGQVAATPGPVKPKWVNRFDGGQGTALQVSVVNAAIRVFDMLIEVAQARHAARFGADPGSSYNPTYPSGDANDDPFVVFANYLWDNFLSKYEMATLEGRTAALHLMTKRDWDGDGRIFGGGYPGSATWVYARALNLRLDPRDPPPPAPIPALKVFPGARGPVVGSNQLLGNWIDTAGDLRADFFSQSQNLSQILHFNNGMGWYTNGDEPGMRTRFEGLLPYLTRPVPNDADKIGIARWLVKYGYVDYLLQGSREWTPQQIAGLKARIILIPDVALAFYNGANLDNRREWKEIIFTVRFSRDIGRPISPIKAWIGYEFASQEGYSWHGIDAFSDIIATEAGRLFAEDLLRADSAITTKASVLARLTTHFQQARASLVAYLKTQSTRQVLQQALLTCLTQTDPKTGLFAPNVKNGGTLHPNAIIWKSTLSRMILENRSMWRNRQDEDAFVQALKTKLLEYHQVAFRGPANELLVAEEMATLNQMIEVLMLYEDL